jgi:hypothetical protein
MMGPRVTLLIVAISGELSIPLDYFAVGVMVWKDFDKAVEILRR